MTYSISRILRFVEKRMDGPQSYIKADEADLEAEEQ